jgi:hypothetical protein
MSNKKLPVEALEYFRKQGSKGGKMSAPARMEKLSAEQRSEIAKKASQAAALVRTEKAAAKRSAAAKKTLAKKNTTRKPKTVR